MYCSYVEVSLYEYAFRAAQVHAGMDDHEQSWSMVVRTPHVGMAWEKNATTLNVYKVTCSNVSYVYYNVCVVMSFYEL